MYRLLCAVLLFSFPLMADEVARRVAFDIGSGMIKMQVADVDVRVGKIAKELLIENARVLLREDLDLGTIGTFSDEIQDQTVEAIKDLMKKAEPFAPFACFGVATEPLRLAANGKELAQRIEKETGLVVDILSQEEEGILGFITGASAADVNLDKAVAWETGGGSFQITTKCGEDFLVYQGKLGKIPMKNAILKLQGKESGSVNPISRADAELAIDFVKSKIRDVPDALREKLKDPEVIVLGLGVNSLWKMHENFWNFEKQNVREAYESRLNLTDESLASKESLPLFLACYVVSTQLLTYGVMDGLGIDRVRYVGTLGGLTTGALVSPKYW